jgi:hypothetical protein
MAAPTLKRPQSPCSPAAPPRLAHSRAYRGNAVDQERVLGGGTVSDDPPGSPSPSSGPRQAYGTTRVTPDGVLALLAHWHA